MDRASPEKKRQKVSSTKIDDGSNVLEELVKLASHSGGKTVECTVTYRVCLKMTQLFTYVVEETELNKEDHR